MRFGMAVGKGETAAKIVIRPGRVEPAGNVHADGERRVIETFGVFIHEHPEVGRRRRTAVRHFSERVVRRVAAVLKRIVEPRAIDVTRLFQAS